MADDYAELERLRSYGEKVLRRLRDRPADVPAHIRVAREETERIAAELVERSKERQSFGFVGDFNAGKSRLLARVLRMPELLKVSGAPTTGNVTAVRVLPVPYGEAPRVTAAWIGFLSLDAVAECAAFVMAKLEAVVRECRLPYPISGLRNYNPINDGWERLEEFARPLWRDPHANAEVRAHVYELLKLRDAVARGSRLLPASDPGPQHAVDPALPERAVEIGGSRDIPADFPERRFVAPLPADADLTAETLREVFPLVRRVTYQVEMPERLWDLSAVRDPRGIELCDHPGLNTLGGARDEFLSRRELRRITSIAVVVNARQAETVGPARLRGLLEGGRRSRELLRDSLLVVGNHFDVIEPIPVGSPVALAALRERSEELASLLRAAGELSGGHPERTVLTCAVFHQNPETRERAERWRPVAAALHAHAAGDADAPEHGIARALAAYADDGGIESLRRRIAAHLGEHGVRILVGECRALRRDLRDRLERLHRLETGGSSADRDEERLAHVVRELTRASSAMREQIMRLGDPAVLTLPDGRPLLDHVRHAAINDVYLWEQWAKTLRRSVNGTIGPRAAGGFRFPGITDDDPDDDADDTTDGLREPYLNGLAEVHQEAFKLLAEAVDRWVAECEEAVRAARELLEDPRTRGLLEDRLALLDPRDGGARRLLLLGYLTNPRQWVPGALRESIEAAGGGDLIPDEHHFPLAAGHALPWHPAFGRHAEAQEQTAARRHQSRLFQLRRDLANAMTYTVQSRVARVLSDLHGRLAAAVDHLDRKVPTPGDLGRIRAPRPDAGAVSDGYGDLLDEDEHMNTGGGRHGTSFGIGGPGF
ncbi:hypothetical protein AB0K60_16600 [Thermopolyspora sp. NPDC052614]|uniref:hypothetical protein n=1 Tax=Thermopolyspora sp. NPDC052614 TaxID=3155682 RepID=UPI0034470570